MTGAEAPAAASSCMATQVYPPVAGVAMPPVRKTLRDSPADPENLTERGTDAEARFRRAGPLTPGEAIRTLWRHSPPGRRLKGEYGSRTGRPSG